MFEFTRDVLDIVFGYAGWNTFLRVLVILILPVLLPFGIFMDILFGITYYIVDFYYYLFS